MSDIIYQRIISFANNMKVAFISCHSFDKPGGVKNHILGLHKEFKKRGVQSKIIAPRRLASENYGKDVILLGTSFPLRFSGSQGDLDINFNPLAIESCLKKEKFDVLHFHNFGFPSALQILERSKSMNILTFHADLSGSGIVRTFPQIVKLINKIVQWKIDGIIGVAPLILKIFKDYKGPKVLIPNGVDLDEFNPKVKPVKKFKKPRNKINILFVGRIEERKGLIYLLKAYQILEKKYSNLRLIVVGKGPLMEQSQNFVKENNLKDVHFEGEKKGSKEVARYFNTADIYCSPAIFGESFGIVLLEGMACRKPVVGFSNKGYKQLLEGTKGSKFLARPRDYKGLAKILEKLIKSKKLRKEMGEWGLKHVQKYSWKRIAGQVLDFYKLCQKKSR